MDFYNDNYFDEFFETMEGYMDEGDGRGFDDNVGYRQMPMPPSPPMQPQGGSYPPAAPPKSAPLKAESQKSLSNQPGGRNICNCFNRYTYVWLRDGGAFWIWLVAVYDTYIICYRWNGSRWVSAQIARRRIDFFTC